MPLVLACDRALPRLHLPAVKSAGTIQIEFLPNLTRRGRKLLSGDGEGVEVHAGSFLRERRIVLESALLKGRTELRRILIHELFHFVWMRLGNAERQRWRELLSSEVRSRARGELGWSAELLKENLKDRGRIMLTPGWRDYTCESFCDSAAWRYARIQHHDEFTLARRWCARRGDYFAGLEQRPLAL